MTQATLEIVLDAVNEYYDKKIIEEEANYNEESAKEFAEERDLVLSELNDIVK